ncbi:MAG: hypothetical protein AVDCRST_MAG59-468 [uncultured Thermomicrobiales bacterium]|uniref:Uncharacterized protein n=1 Tax=uncultured Thermomicrobiales bacterium TaxID=1645740 RepID=A0A6J4U2F3_9BACT|nr:MAG: hypothetical protein AVDCRST_MAG59-468 [uncultured Thermomicrobiales bacterium]
MAAGRRRRRPEAGWAGGSGRRRQRPSSGTCSRNLGHAGDAASAAAGRVRCGRETGIGAGGIAP